MYMLLHNAINERRQPNETEIIHAYLYIIIQKLPSLRQEKERENIYISTLIPCNIIVQFPAYSVRLLYFFNIFIQYIIINYI